MSVIAVPGRSNRLANAAVMAIALALAWWLKDFYRRAGCSDLLWVLSPTARLVEWLTGAHFELEAGRGFLSRELRYEIVPSCAGINFMVAAFVSLCCGLVHTRSTWRSRFELVIASAIGAYAATLLANAMRIGIAVRLHEAGAALGFLTPDRLHHGEGVAVYCLFLCMTFAIGARLAGAGRDLAF